MILFNYEKLLPVFISARSISLSKWLQNFKQSKFVPSNLLIIDFRSFTFNWLLLNCFAVSLSGFLFFQMIVKVQSSGFQVAFFIISVLKTLFLNLILFWYFFLHFLIVSVLLSRFRSSSIGVSILLCFNLMFVWSFLYPSLTQVLQLCFSIWSLFPNILKCFKMRFHFFFLEAMVQMTLDQWSNRWHFFLGT